MIVAITFAEVCRPWTLFITTRQLGSCRTPNHRSKPPLGLVISEERKMEIRESVGCQAGVSHPRQPVTDEK